jgi:hypothetical protein
MFNLQVAQTEEGFSEEKILGWLARIIELNTVLSIKSSSDISLQNN